MGRTGSDGTAATTTNIAGTVPVAGAAAGSGTARTGEDVGRGTPPWIA
ncbi:hypothetical protein [Frankia sp. QA3]|nr:hypothetical protein [Frankia sp. QA3]